MKLEINKDTQIEATIRDHSFFLEYLKVLGMVLFGISLTTPILGLVIFDVDTEATKGHTTMLKQLIWDKPILPYVAGFVILMVHWFKFAEINHSLKTTDLNHIFLNFGFFFVLCLYPYFEMNIEFTSEQPHSRAIFCIAWGLLGMFSFWQLNYAEKHHLFKNELATGRIAALKREILSEPIVAIACIVLAYVGFMAWLIGMILLIPLVNFLMARISIKSGH